MNPATRQTIVRNGDTIQGVRLALSERQILLMMMVIDDEPTSDKDEVDLGGVRRLLKHNLRTLRRAYRDEK